MTRTTARLAVLAMSAAALTATTAGTAEPAAAAATYASSALVPIGSYADTASAGGSILVQDTGPAVPFPAGATLTGLQGTVTDVDVTLKGFTHGSPRDVDVLLVSPTGRMAVIMSDVGGYQTQVTDLDVTLDDEAMEPIAAASPLHSGTFRPTNSGDGDQFLGIPVPSDTPSSLAVFDGDQPDGTWELFVMDDNADFVGTLSRGWEISVTTAGPAVYPSTIDVAGLPKGIADVDVSLIGLTHTYPADVDLLLVGPGGQQATVLSDVGTEGVFDTDLVLDDEASNPVGTVLEPGRWKPTNNGVPDPFPAPAPTADGGSALAVFDGTDPNGSWHLFAVDDASGFRGSLTGWSLTIETYGVPPAPVITSPASGTLDQDGALTVAGTSSFTGPVTVRDNDVVVAETVTDLLGAWTVAVTGLATGVHSLTATAVDGYGNQSPRSAAVAITVGTASGGGGAAGGDGSADRTAPRVRSTAPRAKAVGVARDAVVRAGMSEAVRPATVTSRSVYLVRKGSRAHLPARVLWRAGTRTIVLDPTRDLRRRTTYRVVVTTAVRDTAGNRLDQDVSRTGRQRKTWSFTTR